MDDDVLIRAEHVSKKFCRSLKRSLWYGAKGVTQSLIPWANPDNARHDGDSSSFALPSLRTDEFWALRDLSFEVRRGECLGLIGHNGAGKSTLLKILNGLNRPDAGRITLRGRVGALIELSAGFNPILSGRENIYNQAALLGFSQREIDAKFDAIVDFSELEEFLDMPVQNYSSGMRVKLGFAVSAQLEPDILLVDEVLAVGDVGFRFKCLNKMAEIMKSSAVIFVSHSMPQIYRVCNEVMLLHKGVSDYQGRDIGTGIDRYYSHFKNERQGVTGSGEAQVQYVELRSGDQVAHSGEILQVQYGDDIDISIVIRLEQPIRKAKLQFVIWNMELTPVMDVMDRNLSGFDFTTTENGEVRIQTTLENVNLSGGKYSVSAVINDEDYEKVLCRHDALVSLNVHTASASGAHVLLTPFWSAEI